MKSLSCPVNRSELSAVDSMAQSSNGAMGKPSAASRTGMHERDSPPTPLRLRRSDRCQLVMAHNDGVGDVSTIQTTPPFEIYLAAHVPKVNKMISDHPAMTSLASHRLFLLMMYPLFLATYLRTLDLLDRLADRCLGVAQHLTRLFLQILSQTVELAACPGSLIEAPITCRCRFPPRDR